MRKWQLKFARRGVLRTTSCLPHTNFFALLMLCLRIYPPFIVYQSLIRTLSQCFDQNPFQRPAPVGKKNSQRGKLPSSPGDFAPAVTSLSGNTLRDRSGNAIDSSRRQSMPSGRGGGSGSSGMSGGHHRDVKIPQLLEGKLRTDARSHMPLHTRSGAPTPYLQVGVDDVRLCAGFVCRQRPDR